jgi:opacity protein-like surface antigen
MRRIAMIAALAACASAAQAADLLSSGGGYKDSPAPNSWTGFYLGLNAGGAAGFSDWQWPGAGGVTSSPVQNGAIAGGQIGYNLQVMPHIVAGVEASIDWIGASGSHNEIPANGYTDSVKFNGLLADISGRAGYADGNLFYYSKVGAAYAGRKLDTSNGVVGDAFSGTANADHWGLLLGTGIEMQVAPHWTVKGEYNHIEFGSHTVSFSPAYGFPGPGDISYKQTLDVFKAGLNYKVGSSYEPLK